MYRFESCLVSNWQWKYAKFRKNAQPNAHLLEEKEETYHVVRESPHYYGKDKKTTGIPLIPVEAMAGNANGDVQVMDYELEENPYRIPDFEDKGVRFLIRISGSRQRRYYFFRMSFRE